MIRETVVVALFCALFVGIGSPAHAAIVTLSDLNSTAKIDTDSVTGMFNWSVDGQNKLKQQWFWYRVGDTGPEAPINTISPASTSVGGTRVLFTTYTAQTFSVEVDYLLTGGQRGSDTSDMAETIRIHNNSSASLPFHFFQYADFDLSGTASADTVAFLAPNTVTQSYGATSLAETVVTPASSSHEAAVFPLTLAKLFDGVPTTLNNNNSAGPGDVTWAFQWDYNIAPGGTLIISKDMRIDATPEPATLSLLAVAGLLISRRRRN
jgi:hypothetical protein